MTEGLYNNQNKTYFTSIEQSRLPIKYLAELFGVGNEGLIRSVLKKLMAVRLHRRSLEVGDMTPEFAEGSLKEAGLTASEAEEIYKLTSLCTFVERFVIPASHREEAIEMTKMVLDHKGETGFGFLDGPERI